MRITYFNKYLIQGFKVSIITTHDYLIFDTFHCLKKNQTIAYTSDYDFNLNIRLGNDMLKFKCTGSELLDIIYKCVLNKDL